MAEVQEWFKSKTRGFSPEEMERVLGEAKKLETIGFDPRLLNRVFVGDIQPLTGAALKLVEKDGEDGEGKKTANNAPGGFYTNEIEMAEIGIQGIYLQSAEIEQALLHEFAHWLTDRWIKRLHKENFPPPDKSLLHAEKLDADFWAAMDEYKETVRSVLIKGLDALLGGKGSEQYKVPEGLSLYAMTNPREWIAETFKFYYKGMETHLGLREVAPRTYEFLSNFVQGKYFK